MSDDEPDQPADSIDDGDDGEDAALDPYDLDEDGKVSLIEAERGRLGIVDARMEELAEEPGIKGKLAEAAHKVLDELDND
jgi:hypothetical protein